MSDLQKTDRLLPVLTLVLYLGTKPWDSAGNLHEILDFTKLPEELKRYIPDYPVYVLDICHEPDERLLEEVEAFRCVDGEMYDAVWTYTNEIKLLELKEQAEDENGGVNMCQAIREMAKDARMEGISQGISQGVSQGIAQGIRVLIETLHEMGVAEDEISAMTAEKFHLSVKDAETYVRKYKRKD